MYSHTFPHLSERFFKGTAWPTVDVISHLADDDHIFCILYKVTVIFCWFNRVISPLVML